MPIHFEKERYNEIKKNYGAWWQQKLDRPLLKVIITDAYAPQGEKPKAPVLSQENCHDFSYSPEEIIEALDWKLSQYEFLGDAFPSVNFDSFGPGVLAAFCGARLDNSSGAVWFFPEEELPIEQITIKYNPENKWVKRIKSIYEAGLKKWQGQVLLGMPDLGGIMDVVATFRGSENLLMDLYDYPEEVTRLCEEAKIAWDEAYEDLNSVLQPINPGYSDWAGLYSEETSYVTQCDFSYMISTPMFEEFALPSLKHMSKKMTNTIYHLDGVGELPHLDLLLQIDELNAVQWVYGDGQPSARHWVDVYKKIEAANKGLQLNGDFEDYAIVSKEVKKGIYFAPTICKKDSEKYIEILKDYNFTY